MNATTPMKVSTANSTRGVTGWRMAHAEMFFTSARPSRSVTSGDACRSGHRLDGLAHLQKRAGRGHDSIGGAHAVRDGHAVLHHPRHVHRATLDLVGRVHDEDVAALVIGQ